MGERAGVTICVVGLALAMMACGGRVVPDDPARGTGGGDDAGALPESGPSQPPPRPDVGVNLGPPEASQDRPCEGQGAHDVRVNASGLQPWEGQRAWAFASREVSRYTDHDFLITGRVVGGAVDFFCRKAVVDDDYYPGIVFWIDVDDSGICEPGVDLLAVVQYYAWFDDVVVELTAKDMGSSEQDRSCDLVNSWL